MVLADEGLHETYSTVELRQHMVPQRGIGPRSRCLRGRTLTTLELLRQNFVYVIISSFPGLSFLMVFGSAEPKIKCLVLWKFTRIQ